MGALTVLQGARKQLAGRIARVAVVAGTARQLSAFVRALFELWSIVTQLFHLIAGEVNW
jgi:hypothetical protein